ncbi:hypothetical protein [Nocardia carnea]|uniref:hypothetical protein n=1 Tax=Nocardia carnea TaxID=37328 RepID=UPI0024544061|nr:hypothetical protein [Nocardia carnea]
MFEAGDRIRTNRSVNVRYGVIEEVDQDGTVLGQFDDGLRFARDSSMLDDLVFATD